MTINFTVAATVDQMVSLKATRLIITDQHGLSIYDSWQETGNYILFPEVVEALRKLTAEGKYPDGLWG